VQRKRRLPALRRRHDLRTGDLRDDIIGDAQRDLQLERHLRDADERLLRALRVRHGRLQDDLHREHRLQRRALRLHGHDVRHGDDGLRAARDA
jgi:hypothetical protein